MNWMQTGHKQRRYDLHISTCKKYFRKSTDRLHERLKIEARCLEVVKKLNLSKIQRLIDFEHDANGKSCLITEYCGINLRRGLLPSDWRDQLAVINDGLDELKKVKVFHNDVQTRNIFVLDKQLTLIDFDLGTLGKPDRRAKERPGFNTVDFVIDKITNRWKVN